MTPPNLSRAQLGLLVEFQKSMHGDRRVNPRYHRTADILVEHGLLRRLHSGGHWYEITKEGREWGHG